MKDENSLPRPPSPFREGGPSQSLLLFPSGRGAELPVLKGDYGNTVIWHFSLFPEGWNGTYGSSIWKKPQTQHWQADGIGTGFRASITTDSKQMKEVCRWKAQRHLKNIQKRNLFTTGITTPWSPILKSKGGTTLILNMDFKYIIMIFTVYIKDCKHIQA